jgi:hypothetical protein
MAIAFVHQYLAYSGQTRRSRTLMTFKWLLRSARPPLNSHVAHITDNPLADHCLDSNCKLPAASHEKPIHALPAQNLCRIASLVRSDQTPMN